jgi:trimeric autotransporter adhesin
MKKIILKKIPAFNAILRNSVNCPYLRRGLLLGALMLACVGLLPTAQAVVPAPDGVYAGGNTAEGGASALNHLTTGSSNTAIGVQTLFTNTTGGSNTAVGFSALFNNTIGFANTAVGVSALENNKFVSGFFASSLNTAVGFNAMESNNNGAGNTAVGFNALAANETGNGNIAVGVGAGNDLSPERGGNICIGAQGSPNLSNSTFIGNIATTGQSFNAGTNDYVTVRLSDGRLGHTTIVSSRRYKEDIKPLDKTSEALFALKPVSFRLKKEFDETQALGFGLIAEEVEKVNPDLVYRNNKGQVESVKYEMVNAMLLSEFLKEHRKVQQLEATITKQEKGMEALAASLKEQAAQIQKVSAQIQMSKPSPQTAANNQ